MRRIWSPLYSSWARTKTSEGLLARCARGGATLAAGNMTERVIRLGVNVVLARILAPEQFGLMALVLTASKLFEVLTEVGVRQSVVQDKKGADPEFLNVAWWLNAGRGVLMYAGGFVAAPWMASLYGQPGLTPLLRVALLTLVFTALTSPGLFVLEKQLRFGRWTLIMQGSSVMGALLSLTLAFFYANVWALVAGFVLDSLLRFLLSFILCPVRLRLKWDGEAGRALLRFSRGMVGLPILTYLFMQADIFVMGKVLGPQILGLYSLTLTLASMPDTLFTRILGPLMLPALSQMQDEKQRMRENLLRMSYALFLFGFPVVACLALFAKPILSLTYGAPYGEMAGAFAVLVMYKVLYMAGTFVATVYMALGRPGLHRWFTIVRLLLLVAVLYPAVVWFGAVGAAGARLMCLVLAGVLQLASLSRLLSLRPMHYVRKMWDGLCLTAIVTVPAILWRQLTSSDVAGVVGAAVLCGVAWLIALRMLHGSWRARKAGIAARAALQAEREESGMECGAS